MALQQFAVARPELAADPIFKLVNQVRRSLLHRIGLIL